VRDTGIALQFLPLCSSDAVLFSLRRRDEAPVWLPRRDGCDRWTGHVDRSIFATTAQDWQGLQVT
jgi:hypothetical protein